MTAPRWKFWLARLLGNKVVTNDGSSWITAYRWRGVLYVTNVTYVEKGAPYVQPSERD